MFHIVEMEIGHYDHLVELWGKDPGIGVSKADERDNVCSFLDRNKGMNFIAVHDNKIVGTILCGNDGRRGYLYHVFVLPEFRKRHIGKKLVNTCIENLRKENISKCHIMFFNNNEIGKIFWEKIGFHSRDDIGVMSINV